LHLTKTNKKNDEEKIEYKKYVDKHDIIIYPLKIINKKKGKLKKYAYK
jgi:hypothetical protein